MIIIAFSDKTSKFLPRVLCRGLKHTAPIGVHQDKLIMYQFISKNTIKQICLNMRDLQILQQHGWRFIYLTGVATSTISRRIQMARWQKKPYHSQSVYLGSGQMLRSTCSIRNTKRMSIAGSSTTS